MPKQSPDAAAPRQHAAPSSVQAAAGPVPEPFDEHADWDDETGGEESEGTTRTFVVPSGLSGRLDKILAELIPEHSRNRLQTWIEGGHVRVNGVCIESVRHKVWPGDELVVVPQPDPEALAFEAEPVPFEVVDESDDWIIVNKHAGLVVHPGAGNWHGTLLNGLLYRFPELRQLARGGIVHRLDKDTSGLLVVARNEVARQALVRQLQARTVGREYVALVHGWLGQSGTVDKPIGRDPRVPVRMAVGRAIAPKPGITHYRAEGSGRLDTAPVTQVTCHLETGRTHQIRVHMASLGHPLVGDTLYGGRAIGNAQRQMLHARRLRFIDPSSGTEVSFSAELPVDLQRVLDTVEWIEPELPEPGEDDFDDY